MSDDIGRQAVRGVAWLGGGQMVRQAVGLVTVLVLARLLPPEDFGLFAMTLLAAEFGQLITNFGFGAAIIQRRIDDRTILNSCFWINLVIGLVVSAAMIAAGPLLVTYFGRAELQGLLLPLAVNLMIAAAMVVPQSLLTQRLQFRDIIMAQTVGSLVASVVVITAALSGLGYWSLALQPLVGNAVTFALMLHKCDWRPGKWGRWADIRGLMDFSGYVLAGSMVSFLGRNMPTLVIGRMLGPAALAIYSLAGGITGTIIYQVSSVIVRVLFPTLSALKDDLPRLRTAWLRASSAVAAVALPIMALVSAAAHDVVAVAFGSNWLEAGDPLRVLCIGMAFQAVLTTSGSTLLAMGRADRSFHLSILTTAAYAVGLGIGASYSLTAAAVGFTIASIISNVATTALACRACELPFSRLLRELMPWSVAALAAAFVVATLGQALDNLSAPVRLMLCITAGAFTYAGLVLLVWRRHALDLFNEIWSRLRG